MNRDRQAEIFRLDELVQAGAEAKMLNNFLLPYIARRRAELLSRLEEEDFYYQKIDNSELLVIQLRLSDLKKLEREAKSLEQKGDEAEKALIKLNEPEKPEVPKRPLRY